MVMLLTTFSACPYYAKSFSNGRRLWLYNASKVIYGKHSAFASKATAIKAQGASGASEVVVHRLARWGSLYGEGAGELYLR